MRLINKNYGLLPRNISDKKNIDSFLLKNNNKEVVVIQGLGFVGAVMSLICSNSITNDYAVIGVDLANKDTYWKIKSLNEGVFPIKASDPKVEEYYLKAMKKGNLYATYDSYAYSIADTIIIDINLDVQKKTDDNNTLNHYDVDLSSFKKAIESIGKICKENVLILVETTVPPGTCNKIIKPILKSCLQRRGLSNNKFKIAHSYERVMPGPDYIDSIQNFYRVYSGIDEKSANAAESFLKTIIRTDKFPLTRLGSTNATEIAKVLENSYRAMNIAFVVEWSRFAEEAEVNLYEVVEAIRMRPTHRNLMLPGIGVGGYCLTKDPLLASWSRQNLFDNNEGLPQSVNGVRINDKMPIYAYQFMQKELESINLKDKKALMLGVSYRSDVADTRYTPVETFYNLLIDNNCEVFLHDPYVSFWKEIELDVLTEYEGIFNNSLDLVIFSTAHSEYVNSQKLLELFQQQNNLFILDAVGVLSENEIKFLSEKHKVRVVGRGDIS